VNHRHLLPDEIDLLLDGEVGFGVTPLRAHVRECPQCRAELEDARAIMAELERLPHLAPSPNFADRVMAQVHVFEPWHVTALDTARRWVPRSRPARMLAGTVGLSAAFLLSAGALWLAFRVDLLLFFSNLLVERARAAVLGAADEVIAAAFGQSALDALRAGGTAGLALLATGLLVSVVIAALGLRAIAAASRRHRG
jgi:hypothetical protein